MGTYVRWSQAGNSRDARLGLDLPAGVLELVDSHGSEPWARKSVWVRFPPPALSPRLSYAWRGRGSARSGAASGRVRRPADRKAHRHAGSHHHRLARGKGAAALPKRAEWRAHAEWCDQCGHEGHRFAELPPAYVYLLGLYLGDGSISHGPRSVYRLRITLDLAHPRIVDECEAAMREVVPRNRVHRLLRTGSYVDQPEPTHVDVSAYSKSWPCLFPQHGPGPKHGRRIELTDWQHALVLRHPEAAASGPHSLRRLSLHQHGPGRVGLSAVHVQQRLRRHQADLLRDVRAAGSALDEGRSEDDLRVAQGGRGEDGRVHRPEDLSRGVRGPSRTRPSSSPSCRP